jgi:hypothetical protein
MSSLSPEAFAELGAPPEAVVVPRTGAAIAGAPCEWRSGLEMTVLFNGPPGSDPTLFVSVLRHAFLKGTNFIAR